MKASVCIPTYNHAKYIAQCLDGALMQKTNFDYEILVGEDDSSDGTREICKEYAAKYPDKIRLFLNDRKNVIYINGRPTGRWNFINLLKNAKGKYIALCDGDDYWTDLHKLQKQVDFLESHTEFSICGHWVKNVNESGVYFERNLLSGQNCPVIIGQKDALRSTPIHTGSWVFRNTIRHIFENHLKLLMLLPAGDDPLMLLILNYGKGYCFQEFMGVYRIHSAGMWTSKSKVLQQFEMLTYYYSITKLLSLDFTKERIAIVRKAQHHMIRLLKESFRSGEWKQLMKIILSSPLISKKQIVAISARAVFLFLRKLKVRMLN